VRLSSLTPARVRLSSLTPARARRFGLTPARVRLSSLTLACVRCFGLTPACVRLESLTYEVVLERLATHEGDDGARRVVTARLVTAGDQLLEDLAEHLRIDGHLDVER